MIKKASISAVTAFGEKCLAAAVLEQSLRDVLQPKGPDKELARRTALAWFRARGQNGYIFSFENICQLFEIDAAAFRAKLFSNLKRGARGKAGNYQAKR